MSERLDRVDSILEFVAEQQKITTMTLQRTAEQQERHEATLQRIETQQERNTVEIDILLGAVSTTDVEVRALVQSNAENQQRFENLRADSIADRKRSDADRERSDERFAQTILEIREIQLRLDAQMEVMRSLLSELSNNNRRVDDLERRVS